jgi:hypothetical protein
MFAKKASNHELAMQSYAQLRLLCDFSLLSYLEPPSSADCAQRRAAKSAITNVLTSCRQNVMMAV